jgi:hypothetical protein
MVLRMGSLLLAENHILALAAVNSFNRNFRFELPLGPKA